VKRKRQLVSNNCVRLETQAFAWAYIAYARSHKLCLGGEIIRDDDK
jgi:hypothetical protein